jgi:response regulator RpfG family c-di-GMP phosphodiesterase
LEDRPNQLIKIQVTYLIKFADSFRGIEVHIYLNSKYIKLNYADDQFIDILRRLQQKEVTEVFIHQEDCQKLIGRIKDSLSSKSFFDPKNVTEQRVERLEASTQIVKQVIKQLGADSETIKLLTTINSRAMSTLNESPSLFSFIKRFKKNCAEEFLRTTLTSYLMSNMVDQFDWRSEAVKEKGALASILCDIMLEKEDFVLLHAWEKDRVSLPEHIKNHPIAVVEHLRQKRNLVSIETITIIEQHHELPDGSGFPYGITVNRFNQLSCIFIVAQQFIEELFYEGFNYERRLEILHRMQKKYYSKNFERALNALTKVIDN